MEGCGDRSESGTVSRRGHPPAHVCGQDSTGSTTAFSVSDPRRSPICPLPFPQVLRVVSGHSDSSNGTFNVGSIPWAPEHLGLALLVSCTMSSGSLHLLLLFYHLGTLGTRWPFPEEGRRPGLQACPLIPPLHWGLDLWLGGGTVQRKNGPGLPKGLASAGLEGRGF